MTLKTKKPDQGATEIFISEFEKRKVFGMSCPKYSKTAMRFWPPQL